MAFPYLVWKEGIKLINLPEKGRSPFFMYMHMLMFYEQILIIVNCYSSTLHCMSFVLSQVMYISILENNSIA